MADRLYEYVVRLVDQATTNLQRIQKTAGAADSTLTRLTRTARATAVALGLAFGVSQMTSYGQESLQTAAKMDSLRSAIVFASGSAEQGEKNLAFLAAETKRLGLDSMAASQGYKTLQGSMLETGFTAQQANKMFTGVATAATVMGLSADDANGVFTAFGQIMSKGKVQAEELRGQLGERIPGAFALAAKAMGVNQQVLDDWMKGGDLMAKDFLPKLGSQLEQTFGPGLAKASQGLQFNLNLMNNGFRELQEKLINDFRPEIMAVMSAISSDLLPALKEAFGFLRSTVTWIREHAATLKALAFGLGIATIAYTALTLAAKLNAFWMGASTLAFYANYIATYGLSGAWTVLNTVMAANPISLVILAIAALSAIIFYAWNNVEWFRGALTGLWAAIKVVAQGIWDIVAGLHTFDLDRVKRGFSALGNDAGKAFKVGYADGVNKIRLAGAGADADKKKLLPTDMQGAKKPAIADTKAKSDLGKVSEAGRRQTIVNVNITKLVEKLEYHSQSLKEGSSEVESNFTELLIRALNGSVVSLNQ